MTPGRLAVIVCITLLLIGAMVIGNKSSSLTSSVTNPTDSVGNQDNVEWQRIADLNNSYTIQLPPDFVVEDSVEYGKIFRKPSSSLSAKPTSFLYIITMMKGQADYVPEPERSLYTQSEDRMLGGFGAKGFVNNNPVEYPGGTTEYKYFVETEPVQYIVGAYVNGELTKEEVDLIFTTVKLTPDSIPSVGKK